MIGEIGRRQVLEGLGCHAKESQLSSEGSRDCVGRLILTAL